MSKAIKELTDYNQYLHLIGNSSCVVKFTAEWCGPCKKVGPTYHELAMKHGENVLFIEINIDLANEITNHEDVRSIPLFVFYHNGNKLDELRIQGANDKTLTDNVNKFAEKVKQAKKVQLEAEVEVKSHGDGVVLPSQTQNVDMARLVLDNVNDSDSDNDPDEAPKDHDYNDEVNSEYGEDCDLPIEKTIPEDMIKEDKN